MVIIDDKGWLMIKVYYVTIEVDGLLFWKPSHMR